MSKPVPAEQRAEIIGNALIELRVGATLKEISEKHGIAKQTLHQWLLGDVPEQYREIQKAGLIARITNNDEDLANAKAPADIQKHTAIGKFVRWDAERRLPHLFGPKSEVTATVKHESVPIEEVQRRLRFILSQDNAIDATVLSTENSKAATHEGESTAASQPATELDPEHDQAHNKPDEEK